MTLKTAIAAAFISLSTLAAVPSAQASDINVKIGFGAPGYGWGGYHQQHKPYWHQTLSPQQVRWIMQSRGYRNISYFDRRGAVYQMRATHGGKKFFVVVSAHNGRVLDRTRI